MPPENAKFSLFPSRWSTSSILTPLFRKDSSRIRRARIVVVEFDIGERRFRRHEMHLGPATLGRAGHRQRRNRDAVPEFHLICEAVAPNPQLEPFRQPVDHGNADAVQPAGNLVGILIELAARMQLGHDDLGRGTLQLVVVLDVRRNSAPVVDHRDRIVGVYDYLDVVAIPASASSMALSSTSNTM